MTEDPKTERSPVAGILLGGILLGRILLVGSGDPWWARPALWCVLVLSTVLNTWALSINAWANTYYSATVLGMTRSFSFASGIWHAYYTVALGAPLAAVAGMGVVATVRLARSSRWWGLLLPVSFAATGFWCYRLLGESQNFLPWLAPSIAVLTAIAVPAMAVVSFFPPQRRKRQTRLITAASLAGLIAVLSGPAAYAFTPLSSAVSATFPSAGPSGHGGPGGLDGPGQGRMTAGSPTRDGRNPNNGPQDGRGGNRPGKTAEPSDQMVRYLAEHHDGQTWIVAVVGAVVAAPIILDTGQPVMAIGGYNGNDAAPTVDQLRQYVHKGQLRYVWTNGSAGVSGMGGSGEDIDTKVVDESLSWVTATCAVVAPPEYGGPTSGSAGNGDGQATTQLYDCARVR